MKHANSNNPEKKLSKPSKFSNGTQVPPSRRKSLRTNDRGLGAGVVPLPRSNVSLSFVSLFSLYSLMSADAMSRGIGWFTHVHFMIVGCVAAVGRSGVALIVIHSMLYRTGNGDSVRSMQYKLRRCVDGGWLVGWRDGNSYRYRLSSYCEKLIVRSVGRDALRDMAIVVREAMK